MKNILTIVKFFILKASKKKLFLSVILFAIPVLIASWLFEVSNPGFQTEFVKDLAGFFMFFFTTLVILTLLPEELADKDNTKYFFLTRMNKKHHFRGIFFGICSVIFINLFNLSLLFIALLKLLTGVWFSELFIIAFLVFSQLSLITAVAMLLSQFSSGFFTIAGSITVFFIGLLTPLVRQTFSTNSVFLTAIFEFFISLIPDLSIFSFAGWQSNTHNMVFLISLFIYTLFMNIFYLAIAEYIYSNKDF